MFRFLGASLIALFATVINADDADVALDLPDTQALALTQQPLLDAQAAAARAAREDAVAAQQLPDPRLQTSISDLTLTGSDRFTLQRETDTQFMVSLTQEFPRGESRRLTGERGEREAEKLDVEGEATARRIRRESAEAWLYAWKAEQAVMIARETEREAELQTQAADIAYTAGRASQADVLTARAARAQAADTVADLRQQTAHARAQLSRWIGTAADRPLCPDLPDWREPPPLETILETLRTHPHLRAEFMQVAVAEADVALARSAYRPGFEVGIGYGYRPAFADYANLSIAMDLPFFTQNRQDRQLDARLAGQRHAEQLAEDSLREHQAEARLNHGDWTRLQERLCYYETEILKTASARVESAVAAWQAGNGSLTAVLDARRAHLDARMKQLELQLDAAKHRVMLAYLAGE